MAEVKNEMGVQAQGEQQGAGALAGQSATNASVQASGEVQADVQSAGTSIPPVGANMYQALQAAGYRPEQELPNGDLLYTGVWPNPNGVGVQSDSIAVRPDGRAYHLDNPQVVFTPAEFIADPSNSWKFAIGAGPRPGLGVPINAIIHPFGLGWSHPRQGGHHPAGPSGGRRPGGRHAGPEDELTEGRETGAGLGAGATKGGTIKADPDMLSKTFDELMEQGKGLGRDPGLSLGR